MAEVNYYDLRHVTGQVTHIDIDNGVVESAGTSFFNKAVLRVLGKAGWGVIQIDNYTPVTGKKFDELLLAAKKLADITEEPVILGEVPHGVLPVPSML
jgi:TldD protein